MSNYSRRLTAAFTFAVLTACGSSGSTDATANKGAATEVATTAAAPAANAPKAIVSLSPTATEMLFAIGAGKQVIAVDDQSNYPADAPKTDLSGFKPNVEAIAGKKPDLVIISDDSAKLSEALGKLNINVVVQPSAVSLDDSYKQITELGALTGHASGATMVIAEMKEKIEFWIGRAPKTKATYYHELDDTLYSATSKTFVGNVYSLFGLTNIADAADKDGFGYPQLNVEYIAKSNPAFIFLADSKCCAQTPATVSARPGWADLGAVKGGQILAVDDDIASRWGPRVADFVEIVSKKLAAAPASVTAGA